MPERMIEAGQANAAQNQAGGAPCVGGATGHGMGAGWANAVSVGSNTNPLIITPHGLPTALAGIIEGIIEGVKKSIAAINAVLTIFRKFIFAPTPVLPAYFSLVSGKLSGYDILATVQNNTAVT
jgi:hypothetical protein